MNRFKIFALLCVLVLMLMRTGIAEAAPAPICGSWNIIASPNVGTNINLLDKVSAISSKNVWAVGTYLNSNGYLQTLIEHWTANAWHVVASPNVGISHNYLLGVGRVPGSKKLWTVGYYTNTNGFQQTLIEQWNGKIWNVVPSPNVGSDHNLLLGIAALSVNNAWAIGTSTNNNGNSQTLIEHWDGISWSIISSPNVGPSNNSLSEVAVVSARNILAVGYYTNTSGFTQTLIEHWDGISWSVITSPNVGSSNNNLEGITAVTASDIWAVGYYQNGSNAAQTLIEHWDGITWSVISSPNIGTNANALSGIANISASDIWAVGTYINSNGITQTLTEQWNGSSWYIVSSPNEGSNHTYLLAVVRIPGTSNLWTVGFYINSNNVQQTFTEYYC